MGEEHLVACVNHVSTLNREFEAYNFFDSAHVVHFNHLATLGLRYRFDDSKKNCMDNKEKWKSGNNRAT